MNNKYNDKSKKIGENKYIYIYMRVVHMSIYLYIIPFLRLITTKFVQISPCYKNLLKYTSNR